METFFKGPITRIIIICMPTSNSVIYSVLLKHKRHFFDLKEATNF